jgi:anthranilate/para-aminobenzoate synthase component I
MQNLLFCSTPNDFDGNIKIRPAIFSSRCIKNHFSDGKYDGAPKISVMKIIEQLEETKRGIAVLLLF